MFNRFYSALVQQQKLRLGNTIVLSLMTVILVVGLVSLSSEHISSDERLEQVNNQRQRAQNAAESVVVILEKNLYDKATKATSKLQEDLGTGANDLWFGKAADELHLVGFDQGSAKPAIKPLYFNGCAIRWRIEPIKLMSKTLTEANESGVEFFVNSERDPNLQTQRREIAGADLMAEDARHFYFRMVVEAYALEDSQARYQPGVSLAPWALQANGTPDPRAQRYLYKAQSQRVIELQDGNPFRYLINYIATDNTGDLEFYPENAVDIQIGGLHTNRRMFFGAQAGATVTIGVDVDADPLRPVAVESAAGIFKISKVNAYYRGIVNVTSNTTNSDQNYQDAETGTVALNGTPLLETNDTRSGEELSDFPVGVNGRITPDVDTYSQWNSGFLDSVNRVGPGVNYYQYSSDNTYSLFQTNRPGYGTEIGVLQPGFATDMPLFRIGNPNNNTAFFIDIYPLAPSAATTAGIVDVNGLDLGNAGFEQIDAVPAVYTDSVVVTESGATVTVRTLVTPAVPAIVFYDKPIISNYVIEDVNGVPTKVSRPMTPTFLPRLATMPRNGPRIYSTQVPVDPNDPNTPPLMPLYRGIYSNLIGVNSTRNTGLVILERGRRVGTPPTTTTAYNNWMRDNYVVYLGKKLRRNRIDVEFNANTDVFINVDVTQEFFDYSIQNTQTIRGLMLTEDQFIDQRENQFQIDNAITSTNVNALTINMARVRGFLGTTANVLKFPGGGSYGSYFNGGIYLERAHHYNGTALDPLAPNGCHPLLPGLRYAAAPNAIVGRVDVGAVNSPIGTAGTWTVYPSLKAVRIYNAANMGNNRISIYTPNMCYIWGNFNTVDVNGKPLPVAIGADSLVALSGAWNDINSGNNKPGAQNTIIRAAIYTNNVPTDLENARFGGSGGAQNIFRFLENWSDKTFSFTGAIVVSGRAKYTRSPIYHSSFHTEPLLRYTYNKDLLTSDGQPLFSPKFTKQKRVFATVSQ